MARNPDPPKEPPQNTFLEIARGKVRGMQVVRKFGRNDDIDSAEDIWVVGGNFPYRTTPSKLTIVSDSNEDRRQGNGAKTVYLEGLDRNYKNVSETVAIKGTTPVTSTKSYLRPLRAYVVKVGSAERNVGTIDFKDNQDQVHLRIGLDLEEGTGDGQTQIAQYTVPANKTAFMTSLRIGVLASPGQTGVKEAHVHIYSRQFQESWRKQVSFLARSDGAGTSGDLAHPIPQDFAAKSDLRFRASVATLNTAVHIEYTLALVTKRGG